WGERRPAARRLIFVGALIPFLAWRYGHYRMRELDAELAAAPTAVVGIVQPNLDRAVQGAATLDPRWVHLELATELVREGADFIVMSETPPTEPAREAGYRSLLREAIARRIGAPAIFAAVLVRADGGATTHVFFNSAFSSDADGTVQ